MFDFVFFQDLKQLSIIAFKFPFEKIGVFVSSVNELNEVLNFSISSDSIYFVPIMLIENADNNLFNKARSLNCLIAVKVSSVQELSFSFKKDVDFVVPYFSLKNFFDPASLKKLNEFNIKIILLLSSISSNSFYASNFFRHSRFLFSLASKFLTPVLFFSGANNPSQLRSQFDLSSLPCLFNFEKGLIKSFYLDFDSILSDFSFNVNSVSKKGV